MSERQSLLPSQDGGPGTLVKPSRDSPAVAMSHQVYPYDANSHFGIPSMASYEAVIRNLSLKQAVAAAAINADQRVEYQPQQHQSHSEQQQRYHRDAELSHQQRSSALLINSSIDRPMFPSSPHHAAVIYHPHVSSYASPRPPPVVLDSSSTVKRPRLMSDFTENKNEFRPLHIEVEPKRTDSVVTGSAYKPQVEAISPTLPADDAHGNEIRHSIDELVSHIHRVDRDIQHLSNNLEKLKKKQELIEEEAKRPVGEKMAASEPNVDGRSQSISQTIYAENRQKVANAHAALNKFGRATIMPLYAQPSDTAIFHENKTKFATFKKSLVLFLKKQQHAARIRERYLSERYDKLLESWSKRLEKMEKRRLKDTKTREFFEKVFPEIKKQREDKERLQRASGNRLSGYARSDANVEQIVENLQEQEEEERKMRNLAVVPPMLLDSRQRQRRYRNDAGLLEDAVQVNMESMSRMLYWTPEEKDIFREKYLQRPKNFGFIAAALENKTASDCVLFYYTSKKSAMYKQLVRRNNASSRKRKLKTVKVEMITAQASREAKEKLEALEQESSSASAVQEKKVEPEGSGKSTPVVSDEPEVSRTVDNVEQNTAPLVADASSGIEAECARPASSVSEAIDERHNGIMCVDGSLPCPDDSGGSGNYDRLGDDSDSMRLGTPEKQRRVSSPFITGNVRLDKASERPAAGNGATLDKKPLEMLKMNNIPSELTAAQLIEAIIAQETQPSNRRRAGSRSSNCSDHTSDTLSADESQSESTALRGAPAVSNATHAERHGDNPFSALRTTSLDANSVPHPLTYELLQSALLSGKLKTMPGVSVTDLKNIPHEINEPRLVLQTSGSVIHPLSDRKASSQKALAGNIHLRVRDVIHSAIEENLQARPVTGDPAMLRSSDELWKIYMQQSHVKLEVPSTRIIGQHGMDPSQVQDLSCRRLDGTLQSKDPYSVATRMWASEGQSGRAMQSPPPAHSHYKLQQPIQAVQIDPRSQDPLYHLAEVAVQRERAEVGERYPKGVSPQVNQPHVRDSDQNIHSPHIGGSISRGTPLLTEDQMRRLAGLNRHEPASSGRRNDPMEVAKPYRDSYNQGANPQVVAMAENVLQYMNPLPNQRAVMEQTIAAIQPHPHVATGNASMSVLMSDFLTAQKMLTTNTAPPRHRLPLQPEQPVSRAPTSQSSVPRSVHDLDMSYHLQRESHNGMIPRTVTMSRSEIERSTDGIMPLISSVNMSGNNRLTAATMIEAIITKEIRDTSVPSVSSASQAELVNRILDPQQPVVTSQERTINGITPLTNGFPSTSSSSGLANRFSVNERIELERNALAASRFKHQERSAAVPTVAQAVEHAVTLGEHIDAMIQKDFSSSRFEDETPHSTESSKYAGSSIDAGAKTSLRSFLENSADFNANSGFRIQDNGAQKSGGPDVMRSYARKSPVIAVSSNSGIGRTSWPRDSHLTNVSITAANHSSNSVQKPRGCSPSVAGASINMVPIVSTAAFIAKTSASGPTFSIASLPISHAVNAPLNRHVASPFSQASPILAGLQVPQQLQEVFAANMLNAASAIKVGLPVQWPTMLTNCVGNLSDVVSTAAAVVEEGAPPIMVWKKKMSQELQRQEQERIAEQKIVASQSSSHSRPSSRSVTPAASSDQEKSMRLASDQGVRNSQSDVFTTQATRTSFSSSWLSSSGSRDGFSEPAAALKSLSPRSPRASGVCDKPLSTIALSHQTMSSLLQSRPVFAIDKSPVDGTSITNGRTATSAENPTHPSSDSVQMPTVFPESPAKPSPAESVTNADVCATERKVQSPVAATSGPAHDGGGLSNGDA